MREEVQSYSCPAVPTPVSVRARTGTRDLLPAGASRLAGDAGMTTAEYAVGTVAACAFAGLLLRVVTSSTVSRLLTSVVERALAVAG